MDISIVSLSVECVLYPQPTVTTTVTLVNNSAADERVSASGLHLRLMDGKGEFLEPLFPTDEDQKRWAAPTLARPGLLVAFRLQLKSPMTPMEAGLLYHLKCFVGGRDDTGDVKTVAFRPQPVWLGS